MDRREYQVETILLLLLASSFKPLCRQSRTRAPKRPRQKRPDSGDHSPTTHSLRSALDDLQAARLRPSRHRLRSAIPLPGSTGWLHEPR